METYSLLSFMIGEIHSDGGTHAHRNKPSELTFKTERDSQTWRTNLWLPGEGWEEGIVRESGIDKYTYLKWITNMDLSYSTRNSAPCYMAARMAWEHGYMYMYS